MDEAVKQDIHDPTTCGSARSRFIMFLLVLTLLATAALLWPAFFNGYPLVFQDSAWYLNPFSGTGAMHPGRTIGYSLLIGLTQQIPSLWSIVVTQALITSALIVRVSVVAASNHQDRIIFPVVALFVILLFSGAAKYTSWVMADVLTAWLFLAGALWMLSSQPVDRAFAVTVAALAVLGHNSHVPIVIATAALVSLGARLLLPPGDTARRSAMGLFFISLLSIPWVMSVNMALGTSSGVFRGTDSFLMNRFVDTGVIIPILDHYCGEKDWVSCDYRKEFTRHAGQADGWFLFNKQSPFNTELGEWGGKEQSDIVSHAFRCCLDDIIVTTLAGTWQQFWKVDSSDGLTVIDTKPVYSFVKHNRDHELEALDQSVQRRGEPVHTTLHPVPEVVLHALFFLIAAGLALLGWRTGRRKVTFLLLSVALFLLINAFVCSFGSSNHDRYQGRVAWLLPFMVVLSVGWLRENRRA